MSELTLLIPANKEVESLPTFLDELNNYDYKILVVLQKEDTETIKSISSFKNIEILIQKEKGYGSALKEGIRKIETTFFCIINADGSMDPKYLDQMKKLCEENDLVYASRYQKPEGGSEDEDIITLVGNYFITFLGNFLFKLNITDILYLV